jgi:hypothetical protein
LFERLDGLTGRAQVIGSLPKDVGTADGSFSLTGVSNPDLWDLALESSARRQDHWKDAKNLFPDQLSRDP